MESDGGVVFITDPALFDDEPDREPFLDELRASIARGLWAKAALHTNGKGLENGADLQNFRNHLAALKKAGKHDWRGAIFAVSLGQTWPRAGLAEKGVACSPLCQRCSKQVPETEFHRTWECEATAKLPTSKASQKLMAQAHRDHEETPCFWLRGVIPSSWTRSYTKR